MDVMEKKAVGFEALWQEAHAAGMVAGLGVVPEPMVVVGGVPGGVPKAWYVSEGCCGFAWIVVKPANCAFAKWCRKVKGSRSEYGGGECVKWVGEFNQSVDRKERYAYAFAGILMRAGINAIPKSRLD